MMIALVLNAVDLRLVDELFSVLSFCSGPSFIFPSRSAHPHISINLSLHQQRAAVLSGAEVIPL